MTEQLDLFSARRAAQDGMARALDHAEREVSDWPQTAYRFLQGFAWRHPHFISEEVSAASKQAGMEQPPTDRAWGAIYRRAIRDKIIVQDGIGRSTRRHASICPRWRSLVAGR